MACKTYTLIFHLTNDECAPIYMWYVYVTGTLMNFDVKWYITENDDNLNQSIRKSSFRKFTQSKGRYLLHVYKRNDNL